MADEPEARPIRRLPTPSSDAPRAEAECASAAPAARRSPPAAPARSRGSAAAKPAAAAKPRSRRHRVQGCAPRPGRPIRRRRPTSRRRRSSRRCRRRFPARVDAVSYWVGDWTIIVPADAAARGRAASARRAGRGVRLVLGRHGDRLAAARRRRFDVIYCLYSTRHRHRVRVKARVGREPAGAVGHGHLAGRQLARARSLRHVRRELHRPSRSPAHPDARRLAGLSAAQGLSARRARASC